MHSRMERKLLQGGERFCRVCGTRGGEMVVMIAAFEHGARAIAQEVSLRCFETKPSCACGSLIPCEWSCIGRWPICGWMLYCFPLRIAFYTATLVGVIVATAWWSFRQTRCGWPTCGKAILHTSRTVFDYMRAQGIQLLQTHVLDLVLSILTDLSTFCPLRPWCMAKYMCLLWHLGVLVWKWSRRQIMSPSCFGLDWRNVSHVLSM